MYDVLDNEFLCSYSYVRDRRCDVPCQGNTKEILAEGKMFVFPRLPSTPTPLIAASPRPHRRGRCPSAPGLPDGGTEGVARGLRVAPRRGWIRPSSLPVGSSEKPFRGKGAGQRRGSRLRAGAPETRRGAGTRRSGLRGPPLPPADGDPRPKGLWWMAGNRGDPDGGTGSTSSPRSPRPLPRSPPCPRRLTPWIPPPEAALPEGAGGKDAVDSSEVIINSRAHRGGRGEGAR